eukprot:UN08079
MLTVRLYGVYILIALQALVNDDIEGFEFSSKFRAETIGDMEKTDGMCRTLKLSKLLENSVTRP